MRFVTERSERYGSAVKACRSATHVKLHCHVYSTAIMVEYVIGHDSTPQTPDFDKLKKVYPEPEDCTWVDVGNKSLYGEYSH